MGTNYYLHDKPPCSECGREHESKHIGKSSAGWCFSLHIIPEDGINDLSDWQRLWSVPGAKITDEYGRETSPEDMLSTITERRWPEACRDPDSVWYRQNYAEPGPHGLARHQIGPHCAGHGSGTWDLIRGEFS